MDLLVRITALIFAVGILGGSADAQNHFAREDQIQAAFFYKFLGYIEWSEAHGHPGDVSRLCILGESPLTPLLDELSRTGHSNIVVTKIKDSQEGRVCSLIFISESELPRLADDLRVLEGSGAVTVSDIPGFADRGGMIEFVRQESHVKFIVNQHSAERQGVRISSQLLALAVKRVG